MKKIFKSKESSLDLNQQIRTAVCETDFSRHGNIDGVALPELLGINRDEAQDWAALKEVEQVCGKRDFTPDIRKIYSNPEIQDEEERIAMEQLAHELKEKIVDKYSQ